MARRPDGSYEYGTSDTSNPIYHFNEAEKKRKATDEADAARRRRHRQQEEAQEQQRRMAQAARNNATYSTPTPYGVGGYSPAQKRRNRPTLRGIVLLIVIAIICALFWVHVQTIDGVNHYYVIFEGRTINF